ncbi:hypothetical protein AgCh_038191 [Apium graveolens]
MGKLNIPLPALPEAVRSEIPTPLLMPVTKTKGEIDARLAQSTLKSQERGLEQERLLMAAQGPGMTQEFDNLLTGLRNSLNNNFFTYRKTLEKTINYIRVLQIPVKDQFLEKRIVINFNDSGVDRFRIINNEEKMLLAELKKAQEAAFPEAYLHPSKGVHYICSTTKQLKHFQVPKNCIMANRRLVMVLESGLKSKKLKTNEDEAMIKILRRYIDNSEANLPKTKTNMDDLGDDERKKDGQNPSGSNSSQSSKPPHKTHFKTVGIGPKEAKVKRRIRRQRRQLTAEFLNDHGFGEKAIWNRYNQDDFKPLNVVDSDEDYFQQLAKRIVRIWVVNIREVRIYYSNGSFEKLGDRLKDFLLIVELKRVISLINGKDSATKA